MPVSSASLVEDACGMAISPRPTQQLHLDQPARAGLPRRPPHRPARDAAAALVLAAARAALLDGVAADLTRHLLALGFEVVAADVSQQLAWADGEVIRGKAHYNPERNGFFLFPADRSKNERVFVVNSAIASIEVEKL